MKTLNTFLIFVIVFLPIAGNSATYNFYFNNTEQGDHGVATPNLTVKTDEDAEAKEGEQAEDPQATDTLPVEESQVDETSKVATTENSSDEKYRSSKFWISTYSVQPLRSTRIHAFDTDFEVFGETRSGIGVGWTTGANFVGVNGLIGTGGMREKMAVLGEIELNPIYVFTGGRKVSGGKLRFGLVAGLSNFWEGNRLHLGLRSSIQFSPSFELGLSYRTQKEGGATMVGIDFGLKL